jgi:dUTP pyrophosphatase
MKIKFKRLHPNATIPQQATELSGGWDVTVTEIIKESKDFVICKLGFALEIPKGYKLTLVPRSSLTKTKWILQNSPGLGDADYTGEYQYRFRGLPFDLELNHDSSAAMIIYDDFPYKVGDRVGQLYLEEVIPIEWEVTEDLSDTERGSGGFGSTGN